MSIKPLSLFKIIALVLVVLCFIMLFLPWVTASVSAFGYSLASRQNVFSTGSIGGDLAVELDLKVGSFWSVMLIIFAILALLAILLAVFGILTDRNLFALPLAALAVLMFLFALFQSSFVKSKVLSYLGEYGSYLSSLFKVHPGIGAWLFLIFGLGACGLLFYEDRTQGKNFFDFSAVKSAGVSMPKVNLGAIGGWACPSCGARNGSGQNFCTSCGTKKPEPRRCANCGATLKPGEVFCSNCGTRAE